PRRDHLPERHLPRDLSSEHDCQEQSDGVGGRAKTDKPRLPAALRAELRVSRPIPVRGGRPPGPHLSSRATLHTTRKPFCAVALALEAKEPLVVEGGTCVGKSQAYLVLSIRFGLPHRKKAVVFTYTINPQAQLVEKDLPMLAGILPVKFNFTMLKGRQNYLCT